MQKIQKVLGIDPGTGRLGWAVVRGNRINQELEEYGCIETKKGLGSARRLELVYEGLESLIEKFKPDVSAVEELYFFKNQKTVIRVGEARGVAVVCLARNKIPVFDYTPLQIKQSVTGYGRADKKQVQLMVKNILKLKTIPRPDDAADAVAVALTHLFFNQDLA
jgi:crossover junction endodeoxyribonuclease RuvC